MSDYSVVSSSLISARQEIYMGSKRSAEVEIVAAGSSLAEKITKKASKQTYYTIRFLVDRPLVSDAYRAYAYFRWVDDILDQQQSSQEDRLAFLARQQMIIRSCYHGVWPGGLGPEEQLVADLIRSDQDQRSGLHTYISQMMAVMAFDAQRRGRLISQVELNDYTRSLATAVTEALHYFIGHDCASPLNDARYLAVTAAHITHMLRDAIEDTGTGYYNIPRDYLEAQGITPQDIDSDAYQDWVMSRTKLARDLFARGKETLAQVENLRCRLAGYAYVARFELVLDAIEKDEYRLRAAYPERKSKRAALKMGIAAFSQVLNPFPGNRIRSSSDSKTTRGFA